MDPDQVIEDYNENAADAVEAGGDGDAGVNAGENGDAGGNAGEADEDGESGESGDEDSQLGNIRRAISRALWAAPGGGAARSPAPDIISSHSKQGDLFNFDI